MVFATFDINEHFLYNYVEKSRVLFFSATYIQFSETIGELRNSDGIKYKLLSIENLFGQDSLGWIETIWII